MAANASPENARVQALFQLLGKTEATSFVREIQGTLQFDLGDAGHWQMKIDRGAVRVTEGTPERPDCVLATDPEEFVRIARGDDNIIAAMLRGAIQLSGDLNVAMSFRRVLPIHA
jgi:putative sterol carrier protein